MSSFFYVIQVSRLMFAAPILTTFYFLVVAGTCP